MPDSFAFALPDKAVQHQLPVGRQTDTDTSPDTEQQDKIRDKEHTLNLTHMTHMLGSVAPVSRQFERDQKRPGCVPKLGMTSEKVMRKIRYNPNSALAGRVRQRNPKSCGLGGRKEERGGEREGAQTGCWKIPLLGLQRVFGRLCCHGQPASGSAAESTINTCIVHWRVQLALDCCLFLN